MRAKLRIRFVVFEKALAMQILDQPEEWRQEQTFRASNAFWVLSVGWPGMRMK